MKPDITTWQLDGSVHPEKVSQNVVIGRFLTLKYKRRMPTKDLPRT